MRDNQVEWVRACRFVRLLRSVHVDPSLSEAKLTPSGVICRSTSSHLTAFHNFLTSSPLGILPDGLPNSPSRGDFPGAGVPFAFFDLPVEPFADP